MLGALQGIKEVSPSFIKRGQGRFYHHVKSPSVFKKGEVKKESA